MLPQFDDFTPNLLVRNRRPGFEWLRTESVKPTKDPHNGAVAVESMQGEGAPTTAAGSSTGRLTAF